MSFVSTIGGWLLVFVALAAVIEAGDRFRPVRCDRCGERIVDVDGAHDDTDPDCPHDGRCDCPPVLVHPECCGSCARVSS